MSRPEQTPITSPRSTRVRMIAGLAGRSARRKQGLMRVEGPQTVRALLQAAPDLAEQVYATAQALAAHPEITARAQEIRCPVMEVEAGIIRAMVRDDAHGAHEGMSTPQGILALATIPAADPLPRLHTLLAPAAAIPGGPSMTMLVLHEVRDPGNVGTLIRTADAAGASAVVLTPTCADPYSPKALRASTGSVFHVPVIQAAPIKSVLESCREHAVTVIATSGYSEQDLFETALPPRVAWIMGNEAHGLPAEVLEAADLSVRIPLQGRAESLNVHTAATVCLFETLRQQRSSTRHK